ncbi:MAG: NUDIX hydrolase [Bacteroidales bacterium]|nr:NUDIX hydrolase [Bacteroidales bacterium]
MMRKRRYCPHCGSEIIRKHEGGTPRDYCVACNQFFYDNPLPVVSTIVVKEREILLVKRKQEPLMGSWCLPSGFAETGESIEAAALRELEEETGIHGKIIDFICVDSSWNSTYGDLIFVTFEAEWINGELHAGDDADEVRLFPFSQLPPLAFPSNTRAVERYVQDKHEYWAIIDSFSLSVGEEGSQGNYLSDKLVGMIEKNAVVIAKRWLNDVRTNISTPAYATAGMETALTRNILVISQFGKWLGGYHSDRDIRSFYRELGMIRKREGFRLSEVLSALSLTRKHIWEFALSQRMWASTMDIYMVLELERRMMLFFDRAAYYITRGFEET